MRPDFNKPGPDAEDDEFFYSFVEWLERGAPSEIDAKTALQMAYRDAANDLIDDVALQVVDGMPQIVNDSEKTPSAIVMRQIRIMGI